MIESAELRADAAQVRINKLEKALGLALCWIDDLSPQGPFASDEYVAMAGVLHDIEPNTPDEELQILERALRYYEDKNA